MKGRVLRVSGIQCLVEAGSKQWLCEPRGRLKSRSPATNNPIVAGDWVEFDATSDDRGVVEEIHPRHSQISRATSGSRSQEQVLAVNADQCIIVVAVRRPALRQAFIDRAVVMAVKGHMEPVLCFNKIDLDPDGCWRSVGTVYESIGYRVHALSALTGAGFEAFSASLENKVSTLVGQSGVGKSTILNRLKPDLQLPTNPLMRKHDRGRHTTSAVELMQLGSGSYVADTPGIKQLQPWGVDRQSLAAYFVEMAPLVNDCRFRDCTHLTEPDCAILQAVESGRIDSSRYEGFCRLVETL